jgi:hypothetical protein
MQLLVISAILVMLGVSTIQDFKERLISVWIFPALLALFIWYRLLSGQEFSKVLVYSLINVGFILTQFCAVFLYYSIKEKKAVNIFSEKIGTGDLLFFMMVSPLFHPTNFIFFLTGSLFIILVVAVIYSPKLHTIPLAGALAIFISIVILMEKVFSFTLYTSDWLTDILMPPTYES